MVKKPRPFNLEGLKERARHENAPKPVTLEDVKNALNDSAFSSYMYTVKLWKQ